MALDATRLGQAMAAAVVAGAPTDSAAVTPAQLEAIWIAIAQEIVTELTANGLVIVTTPDTINGTGAIT